MTILLISSTQHCRRQMLPREGVFLLTLGANGFHTVVYYYFVPTYSPMMSHLGHIVMQVSNITVTMALFTTYKLVVYT